MLHGSGSWSSYSSSGIGQLAGLSRNISLASIWLFSSLVEAITVATTGSGEASDRVSILVFPPSETLPDMYLLAVHMSSEEKPSRNDSQCSCLAWLIALL